MSALVIHETWLFPANAVAAIKPKEHVSGICGKAAAYKGRVENNGVRA
jgi:hypothetical protein